MKVKRIIALGLAACLLAGCGAEEVSEPEDAVRTGEHSVSDKKLDLSIHLHYFGSTVFDDNWPVFKKAEEMTNVHLTGAASKAATDSEQVFNIMMASDELSDIIHTQKNNAIKYGMEGAFTPLNDLIEKYAPNISKMLKEDPEWKKHLTAPDGNIYFISFLGDGKAAMGYYIRQDWLDKLGLTQPKNVDEFYEVLKAFRDRDPNGNGIQDEVPMFARLYTGVIQLVNLFGARTDWYVEDGKVKYGKMTPEFKTGISNVVKWYGEKLIDQEFFTRGGNSREEMLGNDIGGVTRDWFASTSTYNQKLAEKVPNMNFVAMDPPADINGKVWEESSRVVYSTNGWGISYSNKHPEETMKYLDFWFSEEGRRLMNFGIEGVHYDMVDGKPTFKPDLLTGEKPILQVLNQDGAQIEVGFKQDFAYEKQWLSPEAEEAMQRYSDNGYICEQFPNLSFLPEEQKTINTKLPAITTYIDETLQRWILQGQNPEQEFDEYLKKINSLGMSEVIDAYQKAYDRWKAQ